MHYGLREVIERYHPARVNIAPIGPRAWAGFRWLIEMPPIIDHFIPLFKLVLYDTMSLDAVALTPHWSRCHIYLWFPPPVLGEISGNLVTKFIIITSSAYSQLDTLILIPNSLQVNPRQCVLPLSIVEILWILPHLLTLSMRLTMRQSTCWSQPGLFRAGGCENIPI